MFWAISSSGGNVLSDVVLGRNPVIFENEQDIGYIEVNITADDVPEVDEIFHVMLTSASVGGEISSFQNSTYFTVL